VEDAEDLALQIVVENVLRVGVLEHVVTVQLVVEDVPQAVKEPARKIVVERVELIFVGQVVVVLVATPHAPGGVKVTVRVVLMVVEIRAMELAQHNVVFFVWGLVVLYVVLVLVVSHLVMMVVILLVERIVK